MAHETFEVHPRNGADLHSLRGWLERDSSLAGAQLTQQPEIEERGGGDVAMWLSVGISGAQLAQALITSVWTWTRAQPAPTRVRMRRGDAEIDITANLTPDAIERLVERFLQS
ncbi:hypothetical protein ABIA32_001610 [Streptacidiphilus sp. MAP12-20]|uniref:effector-associated constant component EACC1 n=1 Tax=Streptacidiphilus sp. MAP12-20 TaxID=3156299 RepID=UPI00351142F1